MLGTQGQVINVLSF